MDRNLANSLPASDSEKSRLLKRACSIADSMMELSPTDESSIRERVDCLLDQSQEDKTKGDRSGALSKLADARTLLSGTLRLDPGSQFVLLTLANVETSLQSLSDADDERRLHQTAAKDYVVRAIKGRTLFQSNPSQLKNIYIASKFGQFGSPDDELRFYSDWLAALSSTMQAFPKAPNFAFIAADASVNISQLLQKDPKRAVQAEKFVSEGIRWFDQSGLLKDLTEFSENFYAYCAAYRQRAELFSSEGRLDLMLNDVSTLRQRCMPALERYPKDFYLRGEIDKADILAGRVLFEHKRYREALPFVERASHWGNKEGTRLLAQMYAGGYGVSQDTKRAGDLTELAKGQTMKRFTIPCDFDGVKAPFYIYVKELPSEYRDKYPGIEDQAWWLKEARGGIVPKEVVESFNKLQAIAKENKVSYPELCAYALGDAVSNVDTAKKDFDSEPSASRLDALLKSADKAYDELIKAGKQAEAATLEKQLADAAERLLSTHHDSLAIESAWSAFDEAGSRLKSTDRAEALRMFTRSEQLAETLAAGSAKGREDRIASYENLGDIELAQGRAREARSWFEKEAGVAESLFQAEKNVAGLKALRQSAEGLNKALNRLGESGAAFEALRRLVSPAEELLARPDSDSASLSEGLKVYLDLANATESDAPQTRRYLVRTLELELKVAEDTPAKTHAKRTLLDATGDALLKAGDTVQAKAAYAAEAGAISRYIEFLTAKPPQKADGDERELADWYGSLSWTRLEAGQFAKAVEAAEVGLKLKPAELWIEANLAHGLLFAGRQEEALRHYMHAKDGIVNKKPIPEAIADDFKIFRSLGYENAAMDSVLQQVGQK